MCFYESISLLLLPDNLTENRRFVTISDVVWMFQVFILYRPSTLLEGYLDSNIELLRCDLLKCVIFCPCLIFTLFLLTDGSLEEGLECIDHR